MKTIKAGLMIFIVSVLLTAVVEAEGTGFTDVPSGFWCAESVQWAVDREITKGTTDTTFSPGNTCTTAQILTFLWRANQSPEPGIQNPFGDVQSDNYYYKAALWAYRKGLVGGDTFHGNTLCTRAAAVTYLWKLAGSPKSDGNSFDDVSASSDYAPAVSWAVEQGITSGTTSTTFSPDNTCTRGHIVMFLFRANNAGQLGKIFIDGVDLSHAREIQGGLYYYATNGDYSYYDEYGFENAVQVLYSEFVTLFQYNPLLEVQYPLLIKLDENPDTTYPDTNFKGDGYRVGLDWTDWQKDNVNPDYLIPSALYELGHEFTHYFYRASFPYKAIRPYFQTWNEEIISQALSLYMLHKLDGKVTYKGMSLSDYLNRYLTLPERFTQNEQSMKSSISLVMPLLDFENTLGTDEQVKSNWNPEVRYLYDMLLKYSDSDIRHLLDMYDYYMIKGVSSYGKGYIDYEQWQKAFPGTSDFIKDLSKIQPKIEA